jgi:hypothetical protein
MTTTKTTTQAGPAALLQLASGARKAKVLLVAAELDLFTVLAEKPLTERELVERMGLHTQGIRDFLYALVALGLLERRDERYHNTEQADGFLVRDRPGYLGGFLKFLDQVLHPAWDGLAESLRTGKPQTSAAQDGDPYVLYQDAADRDAFLDAMDVLNAPVGVQLAELDWTGFSSFVDVGGARGNLAAQLVRAHPWLDGTVFDLPGVEPTFVRHIGGLGLAEAIRFVPGNFFTDPLPAADVLIFGHVLHNWSADQRQLLLDEAYRTVAPGGAVLVYDPMIDDAAPQLSNVLASLNMLVWSAGGAEYTVAECRSWMAESGFSEIVARPLGATSTVMIGRKR